MDVGSMPASQQLRISYRYFHFLIISAPTPEIPDDLKAVVNGVGEILRKISGELSRH